VETPSGRRRLATYCDVVVNGRVNSRVNVLVDVQTQRRINYKFIAQSTILIIIYHTPTRESGWLGSLVSVLDSGAEGPGFKSQPRRYRVTVLGKLFTPIVRIRASVHQAAKLLAALLRVARVTAGLTESIGSLPPGL